MRGGTPLLSTPHPMKTKIVAFAAEHKWAVMAVVAAALALLSPWSHVLHGDLLTVVQYTAFMGYCLWEFALLVRGKAALSGPLCWIVCLALVFQFCADTGYLADHLGWEDHLEHRFHAVLNVVTFFLIVWSVAYRPLRALGAWQRERDEAVSRLEGEAFGESEFFERARIGLCVAALNAEGGARFLRCNPFFCEELGYTEDTLKAHPVEYFLHPEDRSGTRDAVRNRLGGGHADHTINRYRTGPLHANPGTYVWYDWTHLDALDALDGARSPSSPAMAKNITGFVMARAEATDLRLELEARAKDFEQQLARADEQNALLRADNTRLRKQNAELRA